MKKFLFMAGLCALLVAPCFAQNPDPKAFLLSLQAPPAAEAFAAGQSSLVYKDGSCFVTRYCTPSGSVSCFSQPGNCVLGSNYVWCDGVTYSCPTVLPDCYTLNGTSCTPNGSHKNCDSENFTYECTCMFGSWSCPY